MSTSAQSPAVVPWHFFATHRRCAFPFFVDRGREMRPSFAGSRPREQLVVDADGSTRVWQHGSWQREQREQGRQGERDKQRNPVDRIAEFIERSRSQPAALPSWLDGETLPRTVGFLSYELGRWADGPWQYRADGPWQHRADGPSRPRVDAPTLRSDLGTPVAVLSTYDEVDAWDPRSGRSAKVRFAASARHASTEHAEIPPLPLPDAAAWNSTTRETYRRGFARIREAIAAGDIYQANLSRRAVFPLDEDAADAYARLRQVQPVPWGAFLDFGGFALLSNSPECFLERRGDALVTRPIKGTRPRLDDPQLDASQCAALRADPKEMAEHLMIVDLERNDLGRVACIGSVEVTRFAAVESFATVHHMVSDVKATLRQGTSLAALLRATFPGGSITGAPKLRAMEILAEVEAAERGPYTGAIGFFNGGDHVELSIAIRTALAAGGRVLYSTGGGIVADSDPDREWDETELKLAALHATLAGAPISRPRDDASASTTRQGLHKVGTKR